MPKLSKEEIKAFLRENMGIPEVPEEMLEATSDLISIVIGDEGTSMHASAVQHICENIETVESLQKKLLKVASSPRPKGESNFVITAEEFSVITASFVTALQDKTRKTSANQSSTKWKVMTSQILRNQTHFDATRRFGDVIQVALKHTTRSAQIPKKKTLRKPKFSL